MERRSTTRGLISTRPGLAGVIYISWCATNVHAAAIDNSVGFVEVYDTGPWRTVYFPIASARADGAVAHPVDGTGRQKWTG
jgi:hypothetical protein